MKKKPVSLVLFQQHIYLQFYSTKRLLKVLWSVYITRVHYHITHTFYKLKLDTKKHKNRITQSHRNIHKNFCESVHGGIFWSLYPYSPGFYHWYIIQLPPKCQWSNPKGCPTDTWRNDNVISTSKRRRFGVIMTLSVRSVSAGCE